MSETCRIRDSMVEAGRLNERLFYKTFGAPAFKIIIKNWLEEMLTSCYEIQEQNAQIMSYLNQQGNVNKFQSMPTYINVSTPNEQRQQVHSGSAPVDPDSPLSSGMSSAATIVSEGTIRRLCRRAGFDDPYKGADDECRWLFCAERLLEIYDVFLKKSVDTQQSSIEIMLRVLRDDLLSGELRYIVVSERITDICIRILKMEPVVILPDSAEMREKIWELVKEAMQTAVEKMLEGHKDCEHLTDEFFKYLKKQYGQFHDMGDAVKDSKLLVKTLSYLYGTKDTYGHCFEMICEQILKEPERLRLSEMRGQIWDLLRAALLRVVEKMRGGQTDRENFITGFSECVKRLYEQHEHKSSDMGETVKESKLLVKSLFELRANVGDKRFLKIYEKVLRQKFIFTNSLLFDIDSGLMPLKELVIALKAIMEEMKNSLNHAAACFLSNALSLLICSMLLCQGTLFNFKKKSRLKYLYEKATLLILWRCGDVEQNPGPSSDQKRDFCKTMISMLVDLYRKMKPGQKPKKKYHTKPDGWPAGSWYVDPSKGSNEKRNSMLRTLPKFCTDNGVEVPTEWLNLIEKYLLDDEANARDIYSWLYRHRFVENLNQMSDRLSRGEINKEDRYQILEHFFKVIKPHCLQSEFETLSTVSPDRETNCGTEKVAAVASRTINVNAIDSLAADGDLDRNGTLAAVFFQPDASKIDVQKTSTEGFVAGNNEFSKVQLDNLSSTGFLGLFGDNTACFAASNTTVTPSYSCDKNIGDTANINDDNYRKRKLDTHEDGNETEIATKRYKTSDNGDCETAVPFPNGDDVNPVGEELPKPKDGGTSGFTAIAPVRDNMPTARESDFHERDTISADQPDDLVPCPYCGGSGKVSYSLMNEPEKHLADDFLSEHSSLST